jgi:tRNA/rRNA methyltransferase
MVKGMEHLAVVLVAPQGALNVGAVCRVMANFGTTDLRLVTPCEDYRGADARRMALKARPLLRSARRFRHLDAALSDRHRVVGATARQGKYRDHCRTPRQLAHQLAALSLDTRVALVLGREDRGLTREEVDRCDTLVTIPTADAYPSLNLAQAAAILLYEIYLVRRPAAFSQPAADAIAIAPADHQQLERLFAHLQTTLTRSGFLPPENPHHLMHAFRRLFGRSQLDRREVNILRGVLSSMDALMK